MDDTGAAQSLSEETLDAFGPILQYAGAAGTLGAVAGPWGAIACALLGGVYGAHQAWRRAEETADAEESQAAALRWLQAQFGRLYATDAQLGRQLLELAPQLRGNAQLIDSMAAALYDGLERQVAQNSQLLAELQQSRADAQAFLGQVLHQTLETLTNTRQLRDALKADVVAVDPLDRLLRASDGDAAPQLFRPAGPAWIDFTEGVPYRRAEVDEVLGCLGASPAGVLLIVGDAASGKSVIARYAGFLLALEGRSVFHADMRTLTHRSGGAVGDVLRNLRNALGQSQASDGSVPPAPPVFILEDLHRIGGEDAEGLLDELDKSPLNAHVLVTSRPVPGGHGEDRLGEVVASLGTVELLELGPQLEDQNVFSAIAQHIWNTKYLLRGDAEPPFGLSSDHLSQLARDAKGNLWLLAWMIAAHDDDARRPFSHHAARTHAFHYICGTGGYSENVAERSGLRALHRRNPQAIPALLLAVATASRHETGLRRAFLSAVFSADTASFGSPAEVSDALASLVEHGELRDDGNETVRVPHSVLADLYVEVLQPNSPGQHLTSVLREYQGSLPEPQQQAISAVVKCFASERPGWLTDAQTRLAIAAMLSDPVIHAALLARVPAVCFVVCACLEREDVATDGRGCLRETLVRAFLSTEDLDAARITNDVRYCADRGALGSNDILTLADEMIGTSRASDPLRVTKRVAAVAPNDDRTRQWLAQQWRVAIRTENHELAAQAAAALIWRGHDSSEYRKSIYRALCQDRPPRCALAVAMHFPRRAWVRALRRHVRPDAGEELLWDLLGVWAAQGRAHSPDAIAAHLSCLAEDARMATQVALRGDTLTELDSPEAARFAVEQIGRGELGPFGALTWYALHRVNELWLERALGNIPAIAQSAAAAQKALKTLLATGTANEQYRAAAGRLLKQEACEAAARLDSAETRTALIQALSDDDQYLVSDVARLLGWLEAEEAIPALARLLADPGDYQGVPMRAAEAVGMIGGHKAVQALLDHPARMPEGSILLNTVHGLAHALRDEDAVTALLDCLASVRDGPELLAAATSGLFRWAWRQVDVPFGCPHRPLSDALGIRLRDTFCELLAGGPPAHNLAGVSMLMGIAAVEANETSLRILADYARSGVPDLRAAAITGAAWAHADIGVDLLATARDIGKDGRAWFQPDPLGEVVCAMLHHSDNRVRDLGADDVCRVVDSLLSPPAPERLARLAEYHPETVRRRIMERLGERPLSFRSDGAVNGAAVRFAATELAEFIAGETLSDWTDDNIVSMSLEIARTDGTAWRTDERLRDAAQRLFVGGLEHQRYRARQTAARAWAEFDLRAFTETVFKWIEDGNWRRRMAATEAAAFLPPAEFNRALQTAQRDVDSRVRDATYWARERRREREAQDIALERIRDAADVRAAYRWGQTLIRAGDDWGRRELAAIRTETRRLPAMSAWLSHLHDEVKKAWEKRCRERDQKAPE